MGTAKKQLYSIDFMKLICTVLVVCIHIKPFLEWNEDVDYYFTQGICRLAVPFFFMCNGYLWAKDDDKGTFLYIKRIFLLYLSWTIIYIPLFLDIWKQNNYTLGENIKEFLFQFIFTNIRTHFWYFPAVICGVLLVWLCMKRINIKVIVFLSGILYLIGTLGEAYYWIAERITRFEKILETYFEVFEYTRNGVFFAFFFIALGKYIRKYDINMKKLHCVAGFCCSVVFMYGELIFVKEKEYMDLNMYISLIPAAYFLFQFVKEMDIKWKWLNSDVRNGCVVVFCCHMMVDYYLEQNGFMRGGIGYFGIVMIISILIACAVISCKKFIHLKWFQYLC